MKILKLFLLGMIGLLFFSGCKKEEEEPTPTPDPVKNEFELFIEFWNPAGDDPQISFDGNNSSPEVKIDFSKTFAGIALDTIEEAQVLIDNVRIIDNNNVNYKIDTIIAYEWREDINDWKVDVEFKMLSDEIEDLIVMLILDVSESLGDDFVKVKDYAQNFIQEIFANTERVRAGVIDFSTNVNTFPATEDELAVLDYINDIDQGRFTSLYEAMDTGIEALQNNEAEGKALLTFTDGTDNNSDPQYTPSSLYNKLTADTNGIKINSFTIGLEGKGGLDRPVLEDLAANGGVAEFPANSEELGVVFEKVSKSISNVYNLIYIRNQQIIPEDQKARLKFVIKASPK